MVAGNPDYGSDLLTFTLENRSRAVADAVTTHNALFRALNAKGGIRSAPGGTTINEPIEFKENENFGFFEGHELLSILPQDVHTMATYAWKNASVAVTISGSEMAKNSGPDAIKDIVRAKSVNAEHSMINGLAAAVYGDGSASSGKSLTGLAAIVANVPTNTLGAIDRNDSDNAWWKNKFLDLTTDYGDATKIVGQMRDMALSLVRGSDGPGVIVSDDVCYSAYNDALLDIQRIIDVQKAGTGWTELVFRYPGGQAMVLFDPLCPADRQYFLNLSTIKFRPHADRNMVVSKPRYSLTQDSQVTHMFWMGNCTCNNAALNGVLFT